MKYLILLFMAALSFTQSIAQKPFSKKAHEKELRNHQCLETTKYSADERRKFYPFDTASSIRIVSFDNMDTSAVEHSLPMKNGEIDFSRITEDRTLNRDQIDALTHILYNVTYRGEILTSEVLFCYNPRNAILFYDSDAHLLEFIELCFECLGERSSSETISIGDLCNQKYDLLKNFFLKAGIEIGTIREVRK